MVTRFTGSGRNREGGFSAVHRQDFRAHTTGGDWRHGADQLDMNPPISDPFNGALSRTTVQETLQRMAELVNERGFGWITIGDGYDVGDYNVGDPGITTLVDAFRAAFLNPRLTNGGVILVKAGTYRLHGTVTVPPGMTIMGEPAGTHIMSTTNDQPMFKVLRSEDRFLEGIISSVSYYAANTVDVNKFYNLILSDNIDGYVVDAFDEPKATLINVPMIQGEYGSNIFCERVTFIGRLNNTTPPLAMTKWAIAYDSTTTAPARPTTLQCSDCYFDGMAVAIQFDPIEGALDHLKVERCRAKTGAYSVSTIGSCFISMNLCNADISNNFHVGDVSLGAKAFVVLSNNTVTDANVRVNIMANRGGLTTTNSNALNNLFASSNTNTFAGTIFGNSWGANYNQWYISVGDGINSIGDINGPSAIDIVLQRSALALTEADKRDTHVFVGYGTYTVTAGGLANYVNLIGLDRNGLWPILELNSQSGDDNAGNPTTSFGPYIQKIKFTTSSLTAQYNTITINYANSDSDGDSVIKDCNFEDAGLVYAVISRVDSNKISIGLDKCHFKQTGDYPDNFCFLLTTSANTISVSECTVVGKGYVGGIGGATGYAPLEPPQQTIVVEKCVFDQVDTENTSASLAISQVSVLGTNVYFFVISDRARFILKDTEIICADDTAATARDIIYEPLMTNGDITRYTYFSAREVCIYNSLVIGPDQRFTRAGKTTNLPAVVVEPIRYVNVTNSKLVGACALQVTGITAFQYIEESGSVVLVGNEISGHVDGYSSVVLDIDARKFTVGTSGALPSIVIDDCLINNKFNTSFVNADVTRTFTASTNVISATHINAEGWNVKISNSVFNAKLAAALPSGYTQLAALRVNTLETLTGTLTDSSLLISNCIIKLNNNLDTATSTDRALCLDVETASTIVTANAFNFTTSLSSASTSARSYMRIQTAASSSDTGSIVANNTFSRSGALSLAAIFIQVNSGRGSIIDNDFDQPTLDGSDTTLFNDSVTLKWIKERNRNQTQTLAITAWAGVQQIASDSLGFTGTNNDFRPQTANGNMDYVVQTGGSGAQAVWGIDLTSILPQNVHVISATTNISFAGGTAGGNHFLELTSALANDLSAAATPPGGAMTVTATTPTTNYLVNSTLYPFVWVFYNTTAAGSAVTVSVTPIVVTFRW